MGRGSVYLIARAPTRVGPVSYVDLSCHNYRTFAKSPLKVAIVPHERMYVVGFSDHGWLLVWWIPSGTVQLGLRNLVRLVFRQTVCACESPNIIGEGEAIVEEDR